MVRIRSEIKTRRKFFVSSIVSLCALGQLVLLVHFTTRRRRLPAAAVMQPAEELPQFLAFGDSLTQHAFQVENGGWLAQLQHLYARRADVIGRGFSGYNSRWALTMAPRLFPAGRRSDKTLLVTIFFGANDAVLPGLRQHVPLEEFEANIVALVDLFRDRYPAAQIIIFTPPPVDEPTLDARMGITRKNEITSKYAEVCRQVAARKSTLLLDVYEALGGGELTAAKACLWDGLHLGKEGSDRLFAGLQAILSNLPSLHPEKMPTLGPWHGHVKEEELFEVLTSLVESDPDPMYNKDPK